jgi:hypothetical protein
LESIKLSSAAQSADRGDLERVLETAQLFVDDAVLLVAALAPSIIGRALGVRAIKGGVTAETSAGPR